MTDAAKAGIRLIAGLGNIGPEYETTRHNAGFWFVDAIADRFGARFANEAKFSGAVAKCAVDGAAVLLLKPSTYMNLSGKAVAALARFYQIKPHEVLVAHDELDLPCGAIRIKHGGGGAGHKGLKDIAAKFDQGTWRLRIGIDHPRNLGLAQDPGDFVLQRPKREQLTAIEAALPHAIDVLPLLVAGQFERATQTLHRAAKPPVSPAAKPPSLSPGKPPSAPSAK
jgi:peptidyl-tRNA hydrolase, PTH1 family